MRNIKYKYIVFKIIDNNKMFYGMYKNLRDVGNEIGISHLSAIKLADKEYNLYQHEWVIDRM